LLHLQNEQKEAVVKEEPDLYIYSSKDVDMWAVYVTILSLFCLLICFYAGLKMFGLLNLIEMYHAV
jgi:hypothetical protein